MKRALVTGITGQDGAYLAKFLLDKGYHVIGAQRHVASQTTWRLEELGIFDRIEFLPFELLEFSNVLRAVEKAEPDEIYNLAAQSFVAPTFEQPIYTGEVNGLGAVRLLEAIRAVSPKIKFYQASTSEMFGLVQETPQTERTPFYPRSPYAAAKVYAHWMTVNYRETYGLHAVAGILFNHESPLRGEEFVTRKITQSLARIRREEQRYMELGNLDAERDWGFAGDYVEGMWLMMQRDDPQDYVLATGYSASVREFVNLAADAAGFDLFWEGDGLNEVGRWRPVGEPIIRVSEKYYRPTEVDALIGDASLAQRVLGWSPKTTLKELAIMMVEADLKREAA